MKPITTITLTYPDRVAIRRDGAPRIYRGVTKASLSRLLNLLDIDSEGVVSQCYHWPNRTMWFLSREYREGEVRLW